MERKSTSSVVRRAALLAATLLGGATIGLVGVGMAHASGASNRSQQPGAVYPKNAHGLTYGSAANANSPGNEPDLIKVVASNGKEGYVYRTQLEPQTTPTNPAQAVAQQQARAANAVKAIPVYAADGTTVIGSFVMSNSVTATTSTAK